MVNKFKNNVEFAGKNYKTEITKIFLINFAFILSVLLIYIFTKKFLYAIFLLGLAVVIDVFYIQSFSSTKRLIEHEREDEFIRIISYFQIFINNNMNVYQCFKMLVPYASKWMSEQLNNLLEDIDTDKSVQPFVNFSEKFNSNIVSNVMLSIYQMVDAGESGEQLNQFTIFFSQLSKNQQKEEIDSVERSLAIVDSFPLVGAGAITILITISVLLMMEDIINVI